MQLILTPEAETITVTLHDAVLPPSFVFAVITAFPPAFAVTMPVLLTVAIVSSELLQMTALSDASDGITYAVSCLLSFFSISKSETHISLTLMDIPETGTKTSISHSAS